MSNKVYVEGVTYRTLILVLLCVVTHDELARQLSL